MASDSLYANVKLLLPLSGQHDATRFVDNSREPNGIATFGNARVDTTTTDPFGGNQGVLKLDGTDDRLDTTTLGAFVGTGEYCVEGRVRFDNTNIKGVFNLSTYAGGLQAGIPDCLALSITTGAVWRVYAGGAAYNSTATAVANTWYAYRLERTGTTVTLYIDGVSVISEADSTNYVSANYYFCVGGFYSTAYLMSGYQSDVRITYAARDGAAYTPSSTPFIGGIGQLAGNITEGSYAHINKWLIKSWRSYASYAVREKIETGTSYTIDCPTLDPHVVACTPYIDGKWEANKVVTLGQFYVASNPETSAHLWEVTTAGTFGATEATWNLSGTTTQGTAVLTYVGVLPSGSILYAKIPS